MALDKLVDSTQLDSDLTSVANAIRAKSGGSSQLAFPADFLTEIASISGGGGIVGITQDQNGYLVLSPSEGSWSDLIYSSLTFTPDREYGRVATGGIPETISYIEGLLPSGWIFARVRHKSGTPENFFLGDFGVTSYYAETTPCTWICWNNGAWESVTATSSLSNFGMVLSPNCVYEVDILRGSFP